jgi:hypothetical protein
VTSQKGTAMNAQRIGSIAGVVGPALFVAVFLLGGFLRPGYYLGRTHVSDLALRERVWMMMSFMTDHQTRH